MTEVGFSQLENRWPAALPTGTRSAAMPPAAAPRQNGVMIEAMANAQWRRRGMAHVIGVFALFGFILVGFAAIVPRALADDT